MDDHPNGPAEPGRNNEPNADQESPADKDAPGRGESAKATPDQIAAAKETQKRRFFTLLIVGIVILVIGYMAGSNARQHASADCGDSGAVTVQTIGAHDGDDILFASGAFHVRGA
jgi:hypothetical protein